MTTSCAPYPQPQTMPTVAGAYRLPFVEPCASAGYDIKPLIPATAEHPQGAEEDRAEPGPHQSRLDKTREAVEKGCRTVEVACAFPAGADAAWRRLLPGPQGGPGAPAHPEEGASEGRRREL